MKLYEITEKLLEVEGLYNDLIDEETGEFKGSTEEIEKLEAIVKELLAEKSDGIIKYIRNEESNIKAVEEEMARLKKLKERREKKLESFKEYVKMNLIRLGADSLQTNIGTLALSSSEKTIVQEDYIAKDPRYWTTVTKVEDKFDKATIKKLIKDGEQIEGAYIEKCTKLKVK